MNLRAVSLMILISQFAVANEGAVHEAGVPKVVFWQAVNLGILLIALTYFTKDKIITLFFERRQKYLLAAEKSKKARLEAEKQFLDIKHKLDILSSTTEESVARARAEAADLRKTMINDAHLAAKKIKTEAVEAGKIEAQSALRKLKMQTLSDSMLTARQALTKDIGNNDQQKLQNDFTKNLAEVNP